MCFDQALMGCPFTGDVDSFESKQGIYMNASNELQRTKDKLQQLQVCYLNKQNLMYFPICWSRKLTDLGHPLSKLFINK